MKFYSIAPFFLISMPGGSEWLIILIVVIVLFGGKKIPELARGLGKGVRDFKDAKDGIGKDLEKGMEEPPKKPTEQP